MTVTGVAKQIILSFAVSPPGRWCHRSHSKYRRISIDGANPVARRIVITEGGQPILGFRVCLSFRVLTLPNHPIVCRALQDDMGRVEYLRTRLFLKNRVHILVLK
ncbi:unnamed protein product [Lepeophtheirus salmonis]|uniref:(salmon louse) hypothetical protein n=1 Tax=Lepeophtheirus salmonis TaxID=72036 RepID=A0A7R8CXP8_LEPSM|nr:unnamed protein product [Lepeophtheirus salmonis]CAF2961962.1 unnamed protein product [Lepeophtheirus salmonis]